MIRREIFKFGLIVFLLLTGSAIDDLQARSLPKKPVKSVQAAAPAVMPPPSTSVFGVQMDYLIDDSNGLQQAVAAGAQWVRFDAFDWDRIEPQPANPAEYHWDQVDEASLQRAKQKGLEIIAVVKYTPAWARKHPDSA